MVIVIAGARVSRVSSDICLMKAHAARVRQRRGDKLANEMVSFCRWSPGFVEFLNSRSFLLFLLLIHKSL